MTDINEAVPSSSVRKLTKRPAAGRVEIASVEDSPITPEPFDARERELLRAFSPESMTALAKVKKAFPGSRVTAVLPPSPPRPSTEAERRLTAMEAKLKEKCRVRGALLAELDRIWPSVLKRRRQQRREGKL